MALPRVWYHVGCTVHAASELNLFHRQRTLMLGHNHTGASELADIAWARDEGGLACLVLAGAADGLWRASRLRAQAQGIRLAVTPDALHTLGVAPGAPVWAAALAGEWG